MSKPFHKPSVKKPPYVKKFIPWIYISSCGTANTQLFECLFTGVQDLPSEVPQGGPATPVNSIHSWVFSITALGAVVSRKKLNIYFRPTTLISLDRDSKNKLTSGLTIRQFILPKTSLAQLSFSPEPTACGSHLNTARGSTRPSNYFHKHKFVFTFTKVDDFSHSRVYFFNFSKIYI